MSSGIPTVCNPLVLPATDRHAALPTDRTLVMGVVNVTPDSFSDGGAWFEPADGIRHGLALLAEGADILDVGGESTRPGAERVPEAEERRRVLPVVDALVAAGAVVSVDTMRAGVARACIERGAAIVNDVSGGQADPDMAGVVAETGVPYVLMHWRGPSDRMAARDVYDDVLADVTAELSAQLELLLTRGVDRSQVVLDPGLGFAKNGESNWPLLAGLDRLNEFGLPVLVGASRKRFLGSLLARADGAPAPALARDDATAAVSAIAAAAGAWCVRVHDVKPSADAVRVAARWRRDLPAPRATAPAPAVPGPGTARTEIALTGITATGYHGVFDHERRDGQTFSVDLRLTVAAPGHDELSETADYGAIAGTVHDIITGRPVNLIETLAARIADAVVAVPAVLAVTVTVHKPQAPIAVPFGDVAVTVRRGLA